MSEALPLHPATERFVGMRLEPGEQIRWASSAQPVRWVLGWIPLAGIAASAVALISILVVSSWGPFDVQHPNGDPVMFLLGLLAPLMVTAGLLGLAEHRAKRVAYVVTERRAIIFEPSAGGRERERAFAGEHLAGARLVRRGRGGDVLLAALPRRSALPGVIGFLGVPRPETPHQLIAQLAAGRTGQVAPGYAAPRRASFRQYWFSLVCLAAGAILLLAQLPHCMRAAASSGWPTARAHVLSSHIQAFGGRAASYRAAVVCSYQVDGRDYECRTVTFGDRTGSSERAAIITQMFPANGDTVVHYDPADPAVSVLLPGLSPIGLSWPGIACALLVLGASTAAHVRQSNWPL